MLLKASRNKQDLSLQESQLKLKKLEESIGSLTAEKLRL